jgi:hypothetical protein
MKSRRSPNRKLPLTRMLIRVCNRPLQERHRTGLSREQMSLWLAGYPKTPRLRRPIWVKADIEAPQMHVRFAPESGHC